MQTYIIKSQKDLDKFKDDYGYYIDGNAEFEFSADFTGRLKVDGYLFIKADLYIEAGGYIKAGGYIEAGWYIKAGGSIKAGEYIEAGGFYGIVAGLSITCKTTLSFGLKAFAGICSWKETTEEERTITCGKLEKGTIEYGILKETGLPTQEISLKGKRVSVELDGKKYTAIIE